MARGDGPLIDDVRKKAGIRLIAPFGLNLQLGDVVSVDRDRNLSIEGSVDTLLGESLGRRRRPTAPGDVYKVSGTETSVAVTLAGKASAIFPGLSLAHGGFDVTFSAANAWLLALTGLQLSSLSDVARYRTRVLESFTAGVWQREWALVYEVAKAESATFLASRTKSAKLALALSATVPHPVPGALGLTADLSLARLEGDVTKWIRRSRSPVSIRGMVVNDSFWRGLSVGSLKARDPDSEPSGEEFWQDMDPPLATQVGS
jgi:hypothetical protein